MLDERPKGTREPPARPVRDAPAPTPAPEPAEAKAKATVIKRRPPPPAEAPPDLVRVRALEKGYFGIGIREVLRNPGEVFEMSTHVMRRIPLGPKEHPIEDAVVIETERGQFELPGWVELVGE